jgi:hypothetical protein
MSSAKSDWQTPSHVLELVRRVAPIALDPCTTVDNPVGAMEWAIPVVRMEMPEGAHIDGLSFDWATVAARLGGLIYCNPPYGRDVFEWTRRCCVAGCCGADVIALLPARTDTKWWHYDCIPGATASAVCFWRGRLTFVGAPAPAPFPSALVYWGQNKYRFASVFKEYGSIWL